MDEIARFRQWGSKTPGHPEGPYAGRGDDDGTTGTGIRTARRHGDRGGAPRGALQPPGTRSSITTPTCWSATATSWKAWPRRPLARRPPAARQADRISTTTTRSRSPARLRSRSPRTWANGSKHTAGTCSTWPTATISTRSMPPCRPRGARPSGHRSSWCAPSSATGHRTNRTRSRRTARRSGPRKLRGGQEESRLAARTDVSRSRRRAAELPRSVERGSRRGSGVERAHGGVLGGVPGPGGRVRRRMTGGAAAGMGRATAVVRGRPEGRRHPQGFRSRDADAIAPRRLPELMGGSADLEPVDVHRAEGRGDFEARPASCARRARDSAAAPGVTKGATSTSASASMPWARR